MTVLIMKATNKDLTGLTLRMLRNKKMSRKSQKRQRIIAQCLVFLPKGNFFSSSENFWKNRT